MSYKDQLQPWCVVRLLPEARSLVVGRFRRRSDAESHVRILRQIVPHAAYTILFDGVTIKQWQPNNSLSNTP